MKFSSFFTIQYKQCFIHFGIPSGTSVAESENHNCKMYGRIGIPLEGVNKDSSYIWSAMPEMNLQLRMQGNIKGSVKLCGGYVHGEEIRTVGIVFVPEYVTCRGLKSNYRSKSTTYCWATSLTTPSQCETWSDCSELPHTFFGQLLMSVQQCQQYVIYFYSNQFTVTNIENQRSRSFSTEDEDLSRHVNCAVVDTTLFIINDNKMAMVKNFSESLHNEDVECDTTEVQFQIDVPHANSTLFVVHDTLCVVGGCDEDYEPFSNIYRFDQGTQEWIEFGYSTVSRYGASVVVFTERNQKEIVFIAGGFKGNDMPCSVIEKLSTITKSH